MGARNIGRRLWILTALSLVAVVAAALAPPISQPQEYHQFADQRFFLGIPNFFNVASNAVFFLVGMAGLVVVLRRDKPYAEKIFFVFSERFPYLVFFLGTIAISAGSGYYHLSPDDSRLMWDRLPMAVAVMALLASVLSDRVSPDAGLRSLPVLIALGAASVIYWHWSEQRGEGNLNFYIVVQFYSPLAIILLGIYFPSRYTRGGDMYLVLAFYGAAKMAEAWDRQIYELGRWISGHTLKHLLAALAIYWIVRMLIKRCTFCRE